MSYSFVLLILAVVILIVINNHLHAKLDSQKGIKVEIAPYKRNYYFLTPAERAFFKVLLETINGKYLIFAKVRIADLIHSAGQKSNNFFYFNKIKPNMLTL